MFTIFCNTMAAIAGVLVGIGLVSIALELYTALRTYNTKRKSN